MHLAKRPAAVVALMFALALASCAADSSSHDGDRSPRTVDPELEYSEPTYDYDDSGDFEADDAPGDLDCADVGEEVYVGSDDPDGLDRDNDGWGCESYG